MATCFPGGLPHPVRVPTRNAHACSCQDQMSAVDCSQRPARAPTPDAEDVWAHVSRSRTARQCEDPQQRGHPARKGGLGMWAAIVTGVVWMLFGHMVSFWMYRIDLKRDALSEHDSPFLA